MSDGPDGGGAAGAGPSAALEREGRDLRRLLEAIVEQYGYDFRDYAEASIHRRIRRQMEAEGLASVAAYHRRVLDDAGCMERLIVALTVHVTSMFRDPGFFLSFREKVVPLLRTYPFLRIWLAGCSTGEEVYSMAILLEEEELYERCRIYATDLSDGVLRAARDGIFSLGHMKEYSENYLKAGGKGSLSDHYTAAYDKALFRKSLQRNVVFAQHNLVTDGSFNEFQVILCRNVMIYFNKTLQDRVHHLLFESLIRLGILGLGRKESLRFTPHEAAYSEIDRAQRLYRRMG
jgi:chemotaxis protein methyltransferase CheR